MKQKIYRMIRICFLIVLIIPFITSCDSDEILEETPLDFLAPSNAYNSVSGMRQGISGLHAYLREYICKDGSSQEYFAWRRGLSTDIAYHGEDPASTKFPNDFSTFWTSTNQVSISSWTENYKIIQNANVLINAIDNSESDLWDNNAQQAAYKAEAMFFRAYAYRELVSCFGAVPIVTEAITDIKNDFVRDPVSDVYALIESDLLYGTENLPVRGEEEDPGRITQGAAWHFLGEAYLSEGRYQDAVDATSHVINDYGYALMTERFGNTVDVFGGGDVCLDLFAYGNQNLESNTEAIWVIQYEPLIEGGSSFLGERGFGCAYFRMGNTPDGLKAFRGELYNGVYTGYSDTLGRPVAWTRPTYFSTNTMWKGNWDNDYRNRKWAIKRHFYYDNPESAYDGKEIDFSKYSASDGRDPIKDTTQYIFPYFMKFADPCNHFTQPDRSGGGYENKDNYGLRLAETYLLRAEAYVDLGENELAAADINKIRVRANATPISASEATIDYILDERARELYGEEQRQITLRRTGKLIERILKYNDNPKFPGLNAEDYNKLLPIPQTQIDLCSGTFEQNPGY